MAHADGADLYFERRGSGPPLLLIAGGGGDCGVYGPLADLLAADFTVLTYDRRGNSRSPLHYPPRPIQVDEQSGDALVVLQANGFAEASVYGSSGGASITFELVARYPEVVERALIHEPPIPSVLPDGADILAQYAEHDRIREAEGWEAAFRWFLRINDLVPPNRPEMADYLLAPDRFLPPGRALDAALRMNGNWGYMCAYEVRPCIDYIPDLDRIAAGGTRLAFGCGESTGATFFHRAARELARRLSVECFEFPGGHAGFAEVPAAFAATLRACLRTLE
ncbi:MAG TPA: alpha/beta hydrolase [Actinomycetota bacterium]|nr:alpha/beta hydrolase [Actinomycetota bacterium]